MDHSLYLPNVGAKDPTRPTSELCTDGMGSLLVRLVDLFHVLDLWYPASAATLHPIDVWRDRVV
jgi:hypothetical protein